MKDNSNRYIVDCPTSYGTVAMFKMLAENPKISFRKAYINAKSMPTESKDPNDWPLIFECRSVDPENRECGIYLHTLTCGYAGSGPRDFIECLRFAGFSIDEIDEREFYSEKEVKMVMKK